MGSKAKAAEDSRTSRRFVPAFSVAASLLDKNLDVVHGMVANLSEVGASLLTCRGVENGSYVAIELSGQDRQLVETWARVVWAWDGVAPEPAASGSLVGVSFCGLSADERARIWACSSLPPRTRCAPTRVPFRFDELSEPEVDWFLAREVEGRRATESAKPRRESSLRTPPGRPSSRRSPEPA